MTGRKGERSSGERRGGQQGILPWGFRSRRPSTRRSGFGLRLTVAYGGRKSSRRERIEEQAAAAASTKRRRRQGMGRGKERGRGERGARGGGAPRSPGARQGGRACSPPTNRPATAASSMGSGWLLPATRGRRHQADGSGQGGEEKPDVWRRDRRRGGINQILRGTQRQKMRSRTRGESHGAPPWHGLAAAVRGRE